MLLRKLSNTSISGILVPGGFGQRGIEGMLLAIKWAREQQVPFLGICLGFQVAVIEWARNVLGVESQCSQLLPFIEYTMLTAV